MALVCGVLLAGVLPAAAQAAFGVEKFTATNCKVEGCAGEEKASIFGVPYWIPKAPSHGEAVTQGYTQAGGRVPFGVTDFKVNTVGEVPNAAPSGGIVNHVRVDVAAGLATSPAAVPTCSTAEFGTEVAPGFFTAPTCKGETEIGKERVTVYLGKEVAPGVSDLPLEGTVYNLEPPEGLASYFGAALPLPEFITVGLGLPAGETFYVHSYVKGNVEWGQEAEGTGKGDYHDYFTVEASEALPLISSRQVLYGTSGNGAFITNGTSCPGDNTTFVTIQDKAETAPPASFTTPIGLKGCNLAAENLEGITGLEQIGFTPGFALSSGSTQSDSPDELTTAATVPDEPSKIAQSQVKTASIALPEGMTLNPSAAHGLEACTPAQARIHSATFGVACPAASEVGTATLEVPTLPAGAFTEGKVYLGGPEAGPITSPPYTIYVVANSKRYGVSVRVRAEVIPNAVTGQLTTVFPENPEQPFTNLTLHFNRGVLTSIANPLICGEAKGTAGFEPTAGTVLDKTVAFGTSVTGCASPLPLALGQSTANQSANAGAHTSFTLNLARNDGNQYLGEVKTVLPPGLVGEIPAVTPCEEAPANAGTCAASSQIGTATVLAGSGPTPYSFSGPVFLTNSYKGAPYGLSIAVPAIAGPFNLGTVVTRAAINVNPNTAQVEVDSVLPRIFKGIPLRLRAISVAVNKQNFMLNPTSCSALATASTLRGFTTNAGPEEGTQLVSTPFQVGNCKALKFKPVFKASTSSKTSRVNGASLTTTITMPGGQSNIKAVKVQLPRQLPSRLTTLHKACTEQVFAVNPYSCGSGAFVGGATVKTPTLPLPLKGAAILVSHAGAAFPDLDLVVEEAKSHLRVILTGNTDIKKGITTTNFASTPDVPVSSVTVNLPVGSHSALGAFGNLCTQPLVMPTTITPQNGGAPIKQNTIISVSGCGVRIVGHKVVGNTAFITVRTFAAGRISGSGPGLKTVYRRLNRAYKTVSLKVPLSTRGRGKHKPLHVKLRVGFVPKAKHGARSATTTKVTFR